MLRLPTRRLPSDLDERAIVVLTDGPSSDDYDIADLFARKPTVFGYGRAWQRGRIDYYVAWHDSLLQQLQQECAYPLCILVPTIRWKSWQRQGLLDQPPHRYVELTDRELHPLAPAVVEAAKKAKKRDVYLIGEDGWYSLTGQLRPLATAYSADVCYANVSQQRAVASAWRDVAPVLQEGTETRLMTCWHVARRAQQAGVHVHNLSVHGWPRLVFGAHQEVLAQPFGPVDRTGDAVVFDITGKTSSTEELSHRGASPWLVHYHALCRLREVHPTLAVFVRASEKIDKLRSLLHPCSILVGNTADKIDTKRFATVYHVELPGIVW